MIISGISIMFLMISCQTKLKKSSNFDSYFLIISVKGLSQRVFIAEAHLSHNGRGVYTSLLMNQGSRSRQSRRYLRFNSIFPCVVKRAQGTPPRAPAFSVGEITEAVALVSVAYYALRWKGLYIGRAIYELYDERALYELYMAYIRINN